MNANAFRLNYGTIVINDLTLPPGASKEVKLPLNNENNQGELDSFPYHIDCALKVLDDVFVFKVPCSLSIGMLPDVTVSVDEYKEIVSSPQNNKKQEVLANKLPLDEFVVKLRNNNLVEIVRHENGTNEMMVYACVLLNGVKLVGEIIFDKTGNSVNLRLTGPTDIYTSYFHHALSMIVNL
jgi:hypothetical protein